MTAKASSRLQAGIIGSFQEHTMATLTKGVSVADLKHAIEARDGKALASFYADDALLRIIDHNNPPSKPREVRGKAAIASFHDDVCSRAMTHTVEGGIADGDRLAFTQSCAYPDGMKVFCSAMLELKGGKIVRQTVVQAWDE
jgi:ketosteroid isomerase-like protein